MTGKENTFAGHALASDAGSLDPAAKINANLRNRGAGLVPRVVATDDKARRATVAAGALLARFDLPYGWHVIDDGKRTLVFEPSGKVQINLELVARRGRDDAAILDAIEAETRESYADPQFMRLDQGKIHALGVRNIDDGVAALEQYHLLFPGRDPETPLRARVTSTPDCSADACNLAELILESAVFGPAEEPAASGDVEPADVDGPLWWRKAVALEAADRLEDAEQSILKGVDHIGAASSVAHLYKLRMLRLKEAGDKAGAKEAFRKADHWMVTYASWATSGGEGTALSRERDQFLAELKSLFDA